MLLISLCCNRSHFKGLGMLPILVHCYKLKPNFLIDFACNQGWTDQFRKWHNIIFGAIYGEQVDVDNSLTNVWTETIWQGIWKITMMIIF